MCRSSFIRPAKKWNARWTQTPRSLFPRCPETQPLLGSRRFYVTQANYVLGIVRRFNHSRELLGVAASRSSQPRLIYCNTVGVDKGNWGFGSTHGRMTGTATQITINPRM